MKSHPELIFCAAGSRRFAEIAVRNGITYGARLPATASYPPQFVDQDWKKPNRERYMAALEKWRPRLATVLDLEYPYQFDEVLSWAHDAAEFVTEAVIIIPKYPGATATLPRSIKGVEVRLGYAVKLVKCAYHEFFGWPIHILGGSPQKQRRIAALAGIRAISADCNYTMLMANKCKFFSHPPRKGCKNKYFPALSEVGDNTKIDAPYKCFELSCQNIKAMWEEDYDLRRHVPDLYRSR